MSVQSEASTAPPYAIGGQEVPVPVPVSVFGRTLRVRELAADFQHAALTILAVALVLGSDDRGPRTVMTTAAVAAIWFFACRSVCRGARYSVASLGGGVCALLGTLIGLAAVSLLGFWVPPLGLPPEQLALASLTVFAASAVAYRMRMKLERPRRVLVVGASEATDALRAQLAAHPELPFECVGVVGDEGNDVPSVPWLGPTSELDEVVLARRPDLVVVEDRPTRGEAVNRLLDAGSLDFRIMGVHDFYEHAFGRVPVDYLSPVWFMSVMHLYQRPYPRVTKRLLDIVGAGLALLVLLPVLLTVAALVKLTSKGSVLFRQVRCGEGGRPFEILKFRTMVAEAEACDAPVWATEDDPRVTRFGRMLRRLRIDELPQVWNVLCGDMSLIGPRPERPEFLTLLEETVPFWSRRHLVKPGITGWAQVRRGYTADTVGAADKLSYDLFYLRHRSLTLDLAIALKTARVVLAGFGSR